MEDQNELKKAMDLQNGEERLTPFLPFSEKATAKKYIRMRKHVLERFQAKEIDQIKQDMASYNLQRAEIAVFFSKEGRLLLDWAVSIDQSNRALSFLVEYIPSELIRDELRANNSSILESFILGEYGSESRGFYKEEKKNFQVERFKLLLSIDAEGVMAFMDQENIQKYLVQNLGANYRTALESLQREATSLKKLT